jgi:hypothetical protein
LTWSNVDGRHRLAGLPEHHAVEFGDHSDAIGDRNETIR